jgi:hypothetical protein
MRENERERRELALGLSPGYSTAIEEKLVAYTVQPIACMHHTIKY